MMIESLRALLYPLGLIASILFGSRIVLQWYQSERKKASTASRTFWILSLTANAIMALHAFIQLQYPICLLQTLNGFIAWRNLDLMRPQPHPRGRAIFFMALSLLLATAIFATQSILMGQFNWMREPTMPWTRFQAASVTWGWKTLGLAGLLLFGSRYWIQWWVAEKKKKSLLGKSFWWTSLIGALLSLGYFIRIGDAVNIISFGLGLIPYMRNLVLSNKIQEVPMPHDSLFLFAGEQSGDVLGEKLMRALKQNAPSIELKGVGGPLMRSAGLQCIVPMERFQVMGLSDVLKASPRLFTNFRTIKKEILEHQPKGVVFIDYPDFNMRMASSLKKSGYKGKLVHYVCPSVWAWRAGRVKSLAKTLDLLLAILPFEPSCFKRTSLPVTFVGHPLVSAVDTHAYDPNWKTGTNLDERPILSLFPGSRRGAIALNLPLQWEAAKQLQKETGCQIAVSCARPELAHLIRSLTDEAVALVPHHLRYELMKGSFAALATSGTVTLELGLHAVPTVITYKWTTLNYLVGHFIFRIHLPFYTLVNIICAKEVFPEFIYKDLQADKIHASLKNLLERKEECQQECHRLRSLLSEQDASEEAAKAIGALLT